ncbi:hypothetical protein IWX49DRAFT_413691 [Phyllosticta citricarpa]|uniref:Secreted protein n=2 Tax=Phyllosticta TaxID=121621 RepID=A0ABR1M704_9PEZI
MVRWLAGWLAGYIADVYMNSSFSFSFIHVSHTHSLSILALPALPLTLLTSPCLTRCTYVVLIQTGRYKSSPLLPPSSLPCTSNFFPVVRFSGMLLSRRPAVSVCRHWFCVQTLSGETESRQGVGLGA